MSEYTTSATWPQTKRTLWYGLIAFGGLSLFSFIRGRPGDVETGLFGGLLGGIFASFVLLLELAKRKIAARIIKDAPEAAKQGTNQREDPDLK